MPIWGNRDTEPPAEEYESQTGADGTEQPASRDQAGEPAPASWRAQGETPDGDGAPVPVLTGDIVVLEGQTAVKDPATADAQDGLRQGTEQPAAGAESPIVMGGSEPDVAGADQPPAGAESPIVMGAGEPDVAGAEQPAAAGAESPIVMGAGEPDVAGAEQPAAARGESPIVTEADQPGMAGADEPGVAGAGEPGVAGVAEPGVAGQPAASPAAADAISPQRWSEILVGFVDDPRGSVQTAADAVDQAIDGFVNSVRARQHDLASSWQGAGADTEQLRTALREYRRLGERVQQLDLGQRTSG